MKNIRGCKMKYPILANNWYGPAILPIPKYHKLTVIMNIKAQPVDRRMTYDVLSIYRKLIRERQCQWSLEASKHCKLKTPLLNK